MTSQVYMLHTLPDEIVSLIVACLLSTIKCITVSKDLNRILAGKLEKSYSTKIAVCLERNGISKKYVNVPVIPGADCNLTHIFKIFDKYKENIHIWYAYKPSPYHVMQLPSIDDIDFKIFSSSSVFPCRYHNLRVQDILWVHSIVKIGLLNEDDDLIWYNLKEFT